MFFYGNKFLSRCICLLTISITAVVAFLFISSDSLAALSFSYKIRKTAAPLSPVPVSHIPVPQYVATLSTLAPISSIHNSSRFIISDTNCFAFNHSFYFETIQLNSTQVTLKQFDADQYIKVSKDRYKPGESTFKQNNFNLEASDNTPYDREVPDTREEGCRHIKYDTSALPTTSVIIPFHNEARSTLLRTVASVIRMSPAHLVKEIILVDDFSDEFSTGAELVAIEKVKLIRNKKREGSIRTRVAGAAVASGEVITYLDSHVECNKEWLEPLLKRIANNPKSVVSVDLDLVSTDSFEYSSRATGMAGGFKFDFTFMWIHPTDENQDARREDVEVPIRTPATGGGLFSLRRDYFEEIGTYDMDMDIWGGDNIEISIRVWLCGGALEIIPCSRAGHVFRTSMPYSFTGNAGYTLARNKARAAEVWLGDYKKYFYEAVPDASFVNLGDLTERLELKRRLQCKEFSWYLENVYPGLKRFMSRPINETKMVKMEKMVTIQSKNMCLDAPSEHEPPQLRACEKQRGSQVWFFSDDDTLRSNDMCLTAESELTLLECEVEQDRVQKWHHTSPSNQLRHEPSRLCLERDDDDKTLLMQSCDSRNARQKWDLKRMR